MLMNKVASAAAALALLGLPPCSRAQEPAMPAAPAAQEGGTPAARFAAVKADHEKAMKVFEDAYQAAKTEEEQMQLLRDLLPKPEPFVARMIAIAKDAPKDPAAAECLAWALDNGRDETQAASILQALQQDHLASAKLGDVCETLRGGGVKGDEVFLRAVLEKSPHKQVRAQACYVLGLHRTDNAALARSVQSGDDAERVKRLADYYGAEWLAAMQKADATKLQGEGEALLERVVAEFGDVVIPRGTMGDRAKADLFEMRNLAIGKLAPEILGKDLDGVEFRLSDYRGKVVFLDFWGYW
jgi:hypothetical protein